MSGDVVAGAKLKAAILGYAMQLEFLGRRGGTRAPEVVTSWVSDMDLVQPDTPSFQIAVLLTKNQLSDLHQRLKVILDQAQYACSADFGTVKMALSLQSTASL